MNNKLIWLRASHLLDGMKHDDMELVLPIQLNENRLPIFIS